MVNVTIYSIHGSYGYEGASLQRPFVLRKGQKMITHTSAGGSCMEFRVIQDLSDLSEHMQFWIRRNGKCMRFCTSTYFTAKHCAFIAEEKGDDSPLCLEQGASPEAASFRSNQLGCTGQESQASQASRWNSWAKQRQVVCKIVSLRDRTPNHYWLMDLFSR